MECHITAGRESITSRGVTAAGVGGVITAGRNRHHIAWGVILNRAGNAMAVGSGYHYRAGGCCRSNGQRVSKQRTEDVITAGKECLCQAARFPQPGSRRQRK